MKTVAIVQARMGSTRLGGKILKPLVDKPVLWHVVNRMRHCKHVDQVIVATTDKPTDDVTEKYCQENGIDCFRGSDDDVLDRFYQSARLYGADHVVRITADCPVVDPIVVDEIIEMYFRDGYDVCRPGTEFPDGLDCAVFSFKVLEDTWQNASLLSDREHISPYMEKHPEKFRVGMYERYKGLAHLRWTLDEEDDYRFLQEIYDRLYEPGKIFYAEDILRVLEKEPHLSEINAWIVRNEGYLKSLKKDEELQKKQSQGE
jgi:spore coat polysaccharide biosynthesis protein SpsF